MVQFSKIKIAIILLIFILGIFGLAKISHAATIYYVDATGGNNANDGISESSPWKTIAKVNSMSFNPGDTILFKRGETWRETLIIPSSGTSGHPITFGSYGIGAKPLILGSTQITNWEQSGTNIWRATLAVQPAQIWFVNTNGTVKWNWEKATSAECISEYDWTWSSGYLIVNAPDDPDTRYKSIEADARKWCVKGKGSWGDYNNDWIIVQDLECRYASDISVPTALPIGIGFYTGSNNIIQRCSVSYIGKLNGYTPVNENKGMCISFRGNNNIAQNNVVHDCGGHGIEVMGSRSNNIIQNNEVYNCYHGSIESFAVNGGTQTGTIIRYNKIYRTADFDTRYSSNNIYVTSESGGTNTGAQIYYNVVYNLNTNGIQVRSQNKDTDIVTNVKIWNNTFYDMFPGSIVAALPNWGGTGAGIRLENGAGSVDAQNNIIVYTQANGWANTALIISNSANKTIDYNCYYLGGINVQGYINQSQSYSTLAAQRIGHPEWDAHSISANPLVVDPATFDFHLQTTSPCIDKGVNVELVSDYEGKLVPQEAGYDIGAYEYVGGDTTPPAAPSGVTVN